MTRRSRLFCQGAAPRAAITAAFAVVLATIFAASLLGSCSRRLGWGVVLWSSPEGSLKAGSVVPVYIISNIQKIYVVGAPGDKKVELPLWQVELFRTKRGAEDRLRELGEHASLYMIAARDGLPLRETPANLAKRVFRLREGQTVKVLAKVPGEVVTTGGEALPGDWYQVMADDGTKGYAFSYAMRLYDESKEGPPVLTDTMKPLTGRVDLVFSRSWRPEYFQEMVDDGKVDLDYFSLGFGLFADAVKRQIRIELPMTSRVYNYTSITEDGGIYFFEGTPLMMRVEGDQRLVAVWTEGGFQRLDEVLPGAATTMPVVEEEPILYSRSGSEGHAVFIVLKEEPRDVIRGEELRRQKLLEAFVDRFGSEFAFRLPTSPVPAGAFVEVEASPAEGAPMAAASTEAGAMQAAAHVLGDVAAPVSETAAVETGADEAAPSGEAGAAPPEGGPARPQRELLSISSSRRFAINGRPGFFAHIVPEEATDSGEIAFRLFPDIGLAGSWEGAFSLRFDAKQVEGSARKRVRWLDFLYRSIPGGFEIVPAAPRAPGLLVTAADKGYEPLALVPARN